MRRRSLLPLLLLALLPLAAHAQDARGAAAGAGTPPAVASRAEVLAVVHRLFDAMRAGDSAGVRAVFQPGAQLASVSVRQGQPVLEIDSVADFARAVGTPHPEPWDERVRDPVVQVDGDFAAVWVEYGLFVGTRFSHCGVDAFHLWRSPAGWRIVSLTDTRRRSGCERWVSG
jgi:hypothetical protein